MTPRPGAERGGAGAVCAVRLPGGPLLGLALLQIAAESGSHDSLLESRAHLARALGFAALARRPGEPRTLLQELQSAWRRSRFGGSGRRHPGSWG